MSIDRASRTTARASGQSPGQQEEPERRHRSGCGASSEVEQGEERKPYPRGARRRETLAAAEKGARGYFSRGDSGGLISKFAATKREASCPRIRTVRENSRKLRGMTADTKLSKTPHRGRGRAAGGENSKSRCVATRWPRIEGGCCGVWLLTIHVDVSGNPTGAATG